MYSEEKVRVLDFKALQIIQINSNEVNFNFIGL